METENKSSVHSYAIPAAIVIAAALIAGAIFLSGTNENTPNPTVGSNQESNEPTVRPVDETDHIRGNPNAPIMLVEYSDYDCPFCKQFHDTMNRIMSEYGEDGRVAWVYRHFPIAQLHPNAARISEAAECVAELGGNEAFWTFSDLVFDERGTNEPTDMTRLPEFAERSGVDTGAFELCLNSGKHTEAIAEDVEEAIAAGGRGTPHTIVLVGDQQGVINGAQPYSTVRQIIETLLTQLDSTNVDTPQSS